MSNLKAPFPYFGGKTHAACEVWAALGDVKNYVEPFAGSAAMLLFQSTPGINAGRICSPHCIPAEILTNQPLELCLFA